MADVSSRRRFPWVVAALAVMMLSSVGLPEDWITLWSSEQSPPAAQAALWIGGFLATTLLIHALVVVQLSDLEDAGESDVPLSRGVVETALVRTSLGVLCGTTLVFLQFAGASDELKLTSVLSDVATVGGILGLLTCAPGNVRLTYRTLRRMREERQGWWLTIHLTLGVIDTVILYQVLVMLPRLIAWLR
jgi:hypothetical protein